MIDPMTIPLSTETDSLGVPHLKRFWAATMATRRGGANDRRDEAHLDALVLHALGVGLHQTMRHLFLTTPTFDEFEAWIIATAGQPGRFCVKRLQATINGQPQPEPIRQWLRAVDEREPVLTAMDLSCWEKNGYVVLRDAVSEAQRHDAVNVIWEYVDASPDAPDSWYQRNTDHGIMVELIQHPALEVNRRAERIHKAFAQLWGTADLWVTADRCGFHPPQREGFPFPGPDLHWDVDFGRPLEFGTQGILYLTDTPPEQGALTVVPGFHNRLPSWLPTLAPGADPQRENLHALGSAPIGAQAGDMVIWHHWLPHGSRPNLGERPRIVQYINMFPGPIADA